jgi:hypothetical protein
MRTGALVLGILGGLAALFFGTIGYGVGSFFNAAGATNEGGTLQLFSVALPVVALIGAGIVKAKPMVGAALMGGSAIGIVLIMGFNFFSLVPLVLLGIGSLLGFLGSQEGVAKTQVS